jgi:mRNA-degrading endonuclease RelE of RelBE toxin-antitoxin system
MEFVETPLFSKIVKDYLSDDEFSALQWTLALHPESGSIIPNSGGIRKVRWPGKGKGKRDGLRIIYYWKTKSGEIWLLTVYAKSEAENIAPEILKALRKEIDP